jgi:sugar phosphate permease
MSDNTPADASSSTHRVVGAFDIRNVIGALLGIYGVVLLVTGLVSDQAPRLTGQLHADLWAGIVLVVVAVVFLTWARLRPIVIGHSPAGEEREDLERPAEP